MWECVAGTTRPTPDSRPPQAVPHRECEVLCPFAWNVIFFFFHLSLGLKNHLFPEYFTDDFLRNFPFESPTFPCPAGFSSVFAHSPYLHFSVVEDLCGDPITDKWYSYGWCFELRTTGFEVSFGKTIHPLLHGGSFYDYSPRQYPTHCLGPLPSGSSDVKLCQLHRNIIAKQLAVSNDPFVWDTKGPLKTCSIYNEN